LNRFTLFKEKTRNEKVNSTDQILLIARCIEKPRALSLHNNVCKWLDVTKAEEIHSALAKHGRFRALLQAGMMVVPKEISIFEFRRWNYPFLHPCYFVYNQFTRSIL